METNSSGAARHFFDVPDLDRHIVAHVHLDENSTARGIVPKILRGQLSAAGIEPILPRTRHGWHAYRRADL